MKNKESYFFVIIFLSFIIVLLLQRDRVFSSKELVYGLIAPPGAVSRSPASVNNGSMPRPPLLGVASGSAVSKFLLKQFYSGSSSFPQRLIQCNITLSKGAHLGEVTFAAQEADSVGNLVTSIARPKANFESGIDSVVTVLEAARRELPMAGTCPDQDIPTIQYWYIDNNDQGNDFMFGEYCSISKDDRFLTEGMILSKMIDDICPGSMPVMP